MWVNKGAYFSPTLSNDHCYYRSGTLKMCLHVCARATSKLYIPYLVLAWQLLLCDCLHYEPVLLFKKIEKMFVNIIQLTSEKK